MSSGTDRPRQRTVAELLAANGGDAVATGRRRRRRETTSDDVGAAPGATTALPPTGSHSGNWHEDYGRTAPAAPAAPPGRWGGAPAEPARRFPQPDRAILREPVPSNGRLASAPDVLSPVAPPLAAPPLPAPPLPPPPAPLPVRQPGPSAAPPRERPTEEMPRLAGSALPLERAEPPDRYVPAEQFRPAAPDPVLTAPIEHQRSPLDEGPATVVGAPPAGAEAWHRARIGVRPGADDGGPATEASSFDFDDEDDLDFDAPPRRRPSGAVASFDRPAGLGPAGGADVEEDVDDVPRDQAAGTGQAWMAVLVQWIVGALGGAALWVGFRFLWRSLPVVGLAAAVLVTVGLVVLVRALLHNDDKRTTVFAVLVGLLLTVSPAILVLLDR